MFLGAFCMFHVVHRRFLLLQAGKSKRRLFFYQILSGNFHAVPPFFSRGCQLTALYFSIMKKTVLLLFMLTPVCLLSQNRYDVVITEIMADPSPPVALPNVEWVEIRNVSTRPVQLQNWRIGDAGSLSGPMTAYLLAPDSVVILCSNTAANLMTGLGSVIPVNSFPSLDNDGDLLRLRAADGTTMHAVAYTKDWYGNEIKSAGGWTLEITDPRNPCTGSNNWKASTHPAGGTPGRTNTTNQTITDQQSPKLLRAYTTDSLTMVLVFDEGLDSISAASTTHYQISGGLQITQALVMPPLFNQVQIRLSQPMQTQTIYTIQATQVKDCSGNMIGTINETRTGLPAEALPGEWIINEVLFNPRSNAYDYVEFLNNSKKIFDASRLYLANRNSSGAISSAKLLSNTPFYIFPGDHIVATEDAARLSQHYLVNHPAQVLVIDVPPTFPDEEGYVIALNAQGQITDELHYHKDWHFKLIDNDEGVSLERVDPDAPTQEPGNWHSAASTAGYGTPTARNSQLKDMNSSTAIIQITPSLFSPDNDGRDDLASIRYELGEQGYVANINIFNSAGIVVRQLVRNDLLGKKGYWNWDGLDEKGKQLPAGQYIVLAELFDLSGKKKQYKLVLTLARYLK